MRGTSREGGVVVCYRVAEGWFAGVWIPVV